MAQSNNPSLVTQNLAFAGDPASTLKLPSSIKDVADQMAALNSKDYTTYSSGGKTHYVWTFLSTETFSTSRWPILVDAFVVGGGGSGFAGNSAASGLTHNGGGGAGGVAYATGFLLPPGAHTFTVGAGSPASVVGGDSSIAVAGGDTLVGKGGGSAGATTGQAGGSGGGGYLWNAGGSETQSSQNSSLTLGSVTNFGNDGGDWLGTYAGQYAAAGGGGAGRAGYDADGANIVNNGSGGTGIQEGVDFYINGTSNWYGGGGAGTSLSCAANGIGGTGGGGNSNGFSGSTCDGQSGTANTGGGGGGHDNRGTGAQNYAGGSGIIIIRLTDDLGSISKSFLYDAVAGDSGQMYNGSCVDFDGTDASVDYGDVTWLDGLTVVSVSCWFYLDGDPPNSAGILVSKDNTLECVVKRSSGNEYSLSINNNHRVFASAPTPAYGEWIHVVYTWNSTGDVRKLYLNGALADTDTGGNQSGNSLADSSAILSIGDRPSHSYEIDGKMADVKIFAKELSAANVKELCDNSKVIIPTKNDGSGAFLSQGDLLLWAPLTDGVGTIAYDGSGYGRDGTYTGTSFLTGQTGCPQLITGYNKPMLFSNPQYIEVPQDSTLDVGTSDFTVSAWIWPKTGSQTNMFMQFAGAAGWRCVGGASDKVRFSVFDNGWTNYASMDVTPALTRNQWNHFAVSVNRDGNAQSYINGVAKSYLNVSGVTGTLTNAYPLRFGAGSYTNGAPTGDYIDGVMNEAIMYIGTALNASEIKALSTRARLKELVVNGGFNVDVSGWTINVGSSSSVTSVNGKAKMVDAASSGCRMDTPSGTPIALTSGKYYLAKVTLGGDRSNNGGTGSWFKWMIGSNYQGCQYHCPAYGTADNGGGEHSLVFKATGSSAYFGFTNGNDAGYVTVDDVSLVELGGPFDPSSECLPPDAMSMGSDVAKQISAKSSNAVESTYSYGGITYKVWTYRTSGTFVVPREIEVDVVVVGGGGGGGYNVGGGGGAGGLVSETLTTVQTAAGGTSYRVVVGEGGEGMWGGRTYGLPNTSGGDSFITIDSATTAVGGGRGGNYVAGSFTPEGCETGGSGGAGRHGAGGCAGTAGQGNAGGSGTSGSGYYAGGGGGGAGAAGANASLTPLINAGDGGNGKNDFINSSVAETAALLAAALPGAVYLAGGGGGSKQGSGASTVGAGGLGGGGKGSNYYSHDGENGQVNTGGGGGGEMDGGSGVVIIRYAMPTPAGYWRNDGTSTWTDLSNNGNTGTVVGSPAGLLFKQGYTASKSTDAGRDNQGFPLLDKNNGAIGFNGISDYVAFTSRVLAGEFTISMWINPHDATGKNLLGLSSASSDYMWITSNSEVDLRSSDMALTFTDSDVAAGVWQYICITRDGSDIPKFYRDSLLIQTLAADAGTFTFDQIGRYHDGSTGSAGDFFFNGQIASLKIYNRALTQTEVKQNFAAQASRFQVNRGIIQGGLVLHLDAGNNASYPGSGTTWTDLSGNGYNGTIDGATYSSGGGGNFDFDGANDGVVITSASNLHPWGGSASLMMWIKPNGTPTNWDGLWGGGSGSVGASFNFEALGRLSLGSDSGTPRVISSSGVTAGAWSHVACVRDGTTVIFYINGVDAGGGGSWTADAPGSTADIVIGQYYGGTVSSNYKFDGNIATTTLYTRALSAGEVEHNFEVMRDRFGI